MLACNAEVVCSVTLGMPTQMFLTSKSSGSSVSDEGAGTVVESLTSRPWRIPARHDNIMPGESCRLADVLRYETAAVSFRAADILIQTFLIIELLRVDVQGHLGDSHLRRRPHRSRCVSLCPGRPWS